MLAAPRLLNHLAERKPQALAVAELDEIYRVILDGCEPHEPIERVARGLRLFHDHLVRSHGIAALPNPRATFGEGGSLMPVDATVVSVDEYMAALEWLDRQLELGADSTDMTVCRLVLVMAFRLGLRRGEIFGIRLCDIHDQGGLYLHVRPHDMHRLKTPSATRTVRIDALLTHTERAWTRQWLARRREEELASSKSNTAAALLFAHSGEVGVSIDGTVRRTMQAIHAVTKEPRLHLHHLRHSCASWLWLKLRAPDYPCVSDLLANMPSLCLELRTAKRLRVLLCGAASGPSRSYTYTIARILGHASPATTLEHYLHVDDLFRATAMLREATAIPASAWQALTGASRSTVYEWRRHGPHGVIVGYRDSVRRRASTSPEQPPAVIHKHIAKPWRKRVSRPPRRFEGEGEMATLSRALQLYNRMEPTADHLQRVQSIANRCDTSSEQIERWLLRARALGSRFGIKNSTAKAGSNNPVPPVPAPEVDLQIGVVDALDDLSRRFERAAMKSREIVQQALETVPSRFNIRRHDVVLRGRKDEKVARLLLKALDLSELVPDRIQLIVRRVRADDVALPSWFRTSRASGLKIKRVPPPGSEPSQARAYARWVGVCLCSEGGVTQGHAWRIGLFLACVAFGDAGTTPTSR